MGEKVISEYALLDAELHSKISAFLNSLIRIFCVHPRLIVFRLHHDAFFKSAIRNPHSAILLIRVLPRLSAADFLAVSLQFVGDYVLDWKRILIDIIQFPSFIEHEEVL